MDHLNLLRVYEAAIYLLSAIISLLFALVIFTLRRNARILQDEKWTNPFAWTFVVLAGLYSLRFLIWLLKLHGSGEISEFLVYPIAAGSGVTNYLFLLVGLRLADKQGLLRSLQRLLDKASARYTLLLFLCLLAILPVNIEGGWARVPDALFSALALAFPGYIIYRNIQFRRDRLMAWVALLSGICYAALALFYGVIPLISPPDGIVENSPTAKDLLIFLISLITKFGLFFPGFSLMLMISGPLEGVNRLLKSVTRESKEYLERDGIVRSICDELQANRVTLRIWPPGGLKDQPSLSTDSPPNNGDNPHPQVITYESEIAGGHRLKGGKGSNGLLSHRYFWWIPRLPKISAPVLFHASEIAKLEAEIHNGGFTEVDKVNLDRIATLIAPLVQASREVSAINEISTRLSKAQIDVSTYDLKLHVNDIAAIIQAVLSPYATGISIKAGFTGYLGVDGQDEDGKKSMRKRLEPKPGEEDQAKEGREKWPTRELEIVYSNTRGKDGGKQQFASFVLATEMEGETKQQLLSNNSFYRDAVANLVADALLDFIRGYLNQLTDKLGKRLGGLTETNAEGWFKEVNEMAQEAELLWVVATQPNSDKLLGEDDMVELVTKLERTLEQQQRDPKKEDAEGIFSVYTLDAPEAGTYHVIKRTQKETGGSFWFGVAQPDFGPELDYISPWRFFIKHFCDIAESALKGIFAREAEAEHKKEMAEYHSLATATITTGSVVHQMINTLQDLISPIEVLEDAVKLGNLKVNERQKRMILSLRRTAGKLENLGRVFSGVEKLDDHQPCSLSEAVQRALELLQDSLNRYAIEIRNEISSDIEINVPFYVAVFALANIINNAKDVIRDGDIKDGVIRIWTEGTEKTVLCRISDNGTGVPLRFRLPGALFNSVCQSDKSYSHGIGLYFSSRSLRDNGARIELTNPGPEPRTSFTNHCDVAAESLPDQQSEPRTTFTIHFPKFRNT